MQYFAMLLIALCATGCLGTHKKGISRYDQYDAVKVDQMVGNNVSGKIVERTVLCLNARRESRLVTALTNRAITTVTNPVVVATTNLIVSVSTNYSFTRMTNALPSAPSPMAPAEGATNGTGQAEASLAGAAPTISSNITVLVATNESATYAPSQTAANLQVTRNVNNQITTSANNLTVSLITNLVVTAETNQAINYATNYIVNTLTNVTIVPTNLMVHDYYLFTELTPPPEFTLFNGESLVVLVDGVRYAFASTNSNAAFIGRKGYTSTVYAVPPEVLVAIANAKEARIRVRGVSSTIERKLTQGCRNNFKQYLLKYFQAPPEGEAESESKDAGSAPAEPTATEQARQFKTMPASGKQRS